MEWLITAGSYKGFEFHVAEPKRDVPYGMTSQEIVDERRLQVSEKPLVDGADVEDFGRKPRIFSAEVIFFGADYRDTVKRFVEILNEGTSGTLILPDLDEAVWAKVQKASRKSSASEGAVTVISISWIEDRQDTSIATQDQPYRVAKERLNSGNTADAIPTIQNATADASKKSTSLLSAIVENPFLKALRSAENAVISTTTTINSVLNVPRALREQVLATSKRIDTEVQSVFSTLRGLHVLTENMQLGLLTNNPTRYNTGLGAVDFIHVDDPVTSVVDGVDTVVTTPTDIAPIQSFPDAEGRLRSSVTAIQNANHDLESQTSGNSSDISSSSVALINSLKDIIRLIETKPTKQVVTTMNTSLLEVCFRNGRTVSEIDAVYQLNTHVDDILDIPAMTVINL